MQLRIVLSCLITIMLCASLAAPQPQRNLMQQPLSVDDATLPAYGTALNATTLANAVAAQAANRRTVYLKQGTWTLATNVTVPANVTLWIPTGTILQLNGGVTLTLHSPPLTENATWHTGTGKLTLMYTPVNVRDLSTAGDGSVTTPWTGWDTALTAWQGSTTYLFAPGHFQLASPMLLTASATQIMGAGSSATFIHYAPTGSSTNGVFHFASGTSINFRSGLHGVAILSANTTLQKVGVNVVDVSGFTMSGVQIGTDQAWTGATSIGLWVHGRDNSKFDDLELYGDLPLQLSGNPNSTVDVDHLIFTNLALTATAAVQPVVLIDGGINVSKLAFTGDQFWARGSDGLRWVDTTTTVRGDDIVLDNIRWRQSINASGYMIRIEHQAGLLGLRVSHLNGGETNQGLKLRNTQMVNLESVIYMGLGVALDVDITAYPITLKNFYKGSNTMALGGLTPSTDSGTSDGRILPLMVLDR